MDEVGYALIAIALVLCAVFVPSAFITGISGQFYRQFALTIAGATVISLIVSLTLSPALCALLLKPHSERPKPRWWSWPMHGFFKSLQLELRPARHGYGWFAAHAVRFARDHAASLWRRSRLRHERIPQDADRLHPAARRRLPDHRHPAAAAAPRSTAPTPSTGAPSNSRWTCRALRTPSTSSASPAQRAPPRPTRAPCSSC